MNGGGGLSLGERLLAFRQDTQEWVALLILKYSEKDGRQG